MYTETLEQKKLKEYKEQVAELTEEIADLTVKCCPDIDCDFYIMYN